MIVIVITTIRGIVIVVAITTIPEEIVIATATTEIGKEDVMMMHPLVSQALAEITVADATMIRFVA